jgi:hypothetical protein
MSVITLRALRSLACALAGLTATAHARAQPAGDTCVESFEAVQTQRDAGALLAARSGAARCADAACPPAIRDKCVGWIDELDGSIPSIVVVAKGPTGADTAEVRVLREGKVLAPRLDGRPIELDPGSHTLRFEHAGAAPIEETLVLHAGHKRRMVSIDLRAAAAPHQSGGRPVGGAGGKARPASPATTGDAPPGGGSLSPLFWVGMGTAAAGLVVGAVAGGVAIGQRSELDRQCATEGCTADDIAAAEVPAHVSTVGFALGGAGAAMGVVALVLWSPADGVADGKAPAPAELRARLDGISLSGSF